MFNGSFVICPCYRPRSHWRYRARQRSFRGYIIGSVRRSIAVSKNARYEIRRVRNEKFGRARNETQPKRMSESIFFDCGAMNVFGVRYGYACRLSIRFRHYVLPVMDEVGRVHVYRFICQLLYHYSRAVIAMRLTGTFVLPPRETYSHWFLLHAGGVSPYRKRCRRRYAYRPYS